MFLIYHEISQNDVIKGLCDFLRGSLMVSHHSAKFGGGSPFGSGNITFLIFHVVVQII